MIDIQLGEPQEVEKIAIPLKFDLLRFHCVIILGRN